MDKDNIKNQDELEKEDERINECGHLNITENGRKIHLLNIIGEIEGHDCSPKSSKTTKYEHILPSLAAIELNKNVDGLLILIHTSGGDVEAGLAIAEMISSLSIPKVSVVFGGSHSIGVPLAVASDYSYIVKSANMMIHPVRMNGTMIGAEQTYEYFNNIQERILNYIVDNSKIDYDKLKSLMLNTEQLARDIGTILESYEAVNYGLIDEIGGIKEAVKKLYELIDKREGV